MVWGHINMNLYCARYCDIYFFLLLFFEIKHLLVVERIQSRVWGNITRSFN